MNWKGALKWPWDVKFLSGSFEYCSAGIPNLTDEQLRKVHNSLDGRLPGREVLLDMYVHVAVKAEKKDN